jgi:hypothetical protein
LRGEVLVAALGLGDNQHLFVAQRFDVVGVRRSASATLLLGMSGNSMARVLFATSAVTPRNKDQLAGSFSREERRNQH